MTVGITARSDAEHLSALLPQRFELRGEPFLSVAVMRLRNIGWLAGRGYNVISVSIPATYRGAEDTVKGEFVSVMWESLADPIVTGRDELGFPKLWADIPDPILLRSSCLCSASWLGFCFFDLELEALRPAEQTDLMTPGEMLAYKYIPRSGAAGREEADVEYATADPAEPSTVAWRRAGQGEYRFHAAQWEDMPTQYPIVNALAALPLHEFHGAFVQLSSGSNIGLHQRILR